MEINCFVFISIYIKLSRRMAKVRKTYLISPKKEKKKKKRKTYIISYF